MFKTMDKISIALHNMLEELVIRPKRAYKVIETSTDNYNCASISLMFVDFKKQQAEICSSLIKTGFTLEERYLKKEVAGSSAIVSFDEENNRIIFSVNA